MAKSKTPKASKASKAAREMIVLTSEFDEGVRDGNASRISVETLKTELKNLSSFVSEALTDAGAMLGDYELDEVTIKVEINASGKIAILGTGISTSATGGLTLKFKKAPPKTVEP